MLTALIWCSFALTKALKVLIKEKSLRAWFYSTIGYRDDSIREVHKNEADLKLPLLLVSYKELYGWTMDEIVAKIGRKNNCTFCGVFRYKY